MIDVPEIVKQSEGDFILQLCDYYKVSIKNPDNTYRNLIDILEELSKNIDKEDKSNV